MICYENDGEWCQLYSCKHKFHKECLKTSKNCPYCRTPFIYKFS